MKKRNDNFSSPFVLLLHQSVVLRGGVVSAVLLHKYVAYHLFRRVRWSMIILLLLRRSNCTIVPPTHSTHSPSLCALDCSVGLSVIPCSFLIFTFLRRLCNESIRLFFPHSPSSSENEIYTLQRRKVQCWDHRYSNASHRFCTFFRVKLLCIH